MILTVIRAREQDLTLAGLAVVALSGAEYRLLRVFLDFPQRVLNRDQLLNLTQRRETEPFDRSIDLLVSRLRRRLKDDAREPRIIQTIPKRGYRLVAPVTVPTEVAPAPSAVRGWIVNVDPSIACPFPALPLLPGERGRLI